MGLFEEIRTGETAIRSGSPLPWLLLFVLAVGWGATFWLARGRLADEHLRNANALKANDELKARFEKLRSERDDFQKDVATLDDKRAALEVKRDEFKAQLQTCTEDLEQAKAKLLPKGKKPPAPPGNAPGPVR